MRRASAWVEGAARGITIAIGLCVVLLTPALATTLAVLSSIPAAAPATATSPRQARIKTFPVPSFVCARRLMSTLQISPR
jgi:hypothetical protein